MQIQCKFNCKSMQMHYKSNAKPRQAQCNFKWTSMQMQCTSNANPSPCPKRLAARRNFQAQAIKFNIAGIQSEATATAGTKCPSTEARTSTEFATLRLGRPSGPAQTQGCNICQSPRLSAWPYCPSFGCGFWLNASNFEFPRLCLEIPTRPKNPPLQSQYDVKAKTMPVQSKFSPNSMQK